MVAQNKLDQRELDRLRYIAAAKVALHKGSWRQLIFLCEQIIRIEENIQRQTNDGQRK